MNRNITAFALGLFLFLRRRGAGAMIRTTLLLIVTLLATGPLPVSAAAPDTVSEWIGIMNVRLPVSRTRRRKSPTRASSEAFTTEHRARKYAGQNCRGLPVATRPACYER
jgi:hypothetical protein